MIRLKQYDVRTAPLPCGETYAYRKAGKGGEPIILLHGNMSSSVHWQTTLEVLEDEYTVYAPDLRGFGESTYNKEFDTLAELAQDVEQFADVLGIGGFYVCGWSAGAGVAMELAVNSPERVKGLILLAPVPPTGYPMFKKGPDMRPIITQPLTTKEDVAADPVQVTPALNALKAGDRATMRFFWDMTIYTLGKPSDEDYEIYLDGIMKQRNLVDVDYALLTFNIAERLGDIKCPITILNGEHDVVVPLAWTQSSLPLYGARAELVTFPDSGHSPVTDEPDAFFAALRAALKKTGSD